jgi:hydrogenase maturation protein HypF
LRAGKHRERRPFAVMVADVDAAGRLCELRPEEALLLAGPVAPILLLPRRTDADPSHALAESVAPGRRELGLMLPSTPLHHLLMAASGAPLVMTSGNLSDEPIVTDDTDAVARLNDVADAFLVHDRPIETRVDDSVVRVVGDRVAPIRRSRGYVPQPLALPWPFPRPVLACGPELKNTFCYGRGGHAIVSAHIGDLANYATFEAYTTGIQHLGRLLGITPEVVAYDLHPEYLSTKYAKDRSDVDGPVELVGVQHHHAHIASCLADNGVAGPVIGVAFDGLGMGTDGTLWGGEFLLADLAGYDRRAHLEPVAMPGGAAAIRQPWRMAVSHLDAAYAGTIPAAAAVLSRHPMWVDVLAAARAGVNAPLTSSMGRLFDAVSAVLGVCDEISYEGQAAIELEQCADPSETGRYDWTIAPGPPLRINGARLVRTVLEDAASGAAVGTVTARFHNSVAQLVIDVCDQLRTTSGLGTVALSGGVFQNAWLLRMCTRGLLDAGFDVLTHHRVPANDGGISLGQAVVAGARDRLR